MEKTRRIFSISADQHFVRTLASAILDNRILSDGWDELSLARLQVFLPTRRACRELSACLLDLGKSTGLLLPRIHSLGDVDEADFDIFDDTHQLSSTDLPAPIGRHERHILLTRLIRDWAETNDKLPLAKVLRNNTVQAWSLAKSLTELTDLFESHNKDLTGIEGLFEGEFAAHREQLTELLAVVRVQLEDELARRNQSSPVAHRTAMMSRYAQALQRDASQTPVIVAGSTASQPATADFMAAIATLANGAVVLPGLDTDLDAASWTLLDDSHPQYGLKQFLSRLDVTRDEVRLLDTDDAASETSASRRWLASEIMRPAETSERWHTTLDENQHKLTLGLKGVVRLAAANEREEARLIALVMRKALAEDKTAALVTPDRKLARYVRSELGRWNIEIDDSAGQPMSSTPPGVFMQLVLASVSGRYSAQNLKSLLHHPMARFGLSVSDHRRATAALEIAVLREKQQWQSLTDIEGFIEQAETYRTEKRKNPFAHRALANLGAEDWHLATTLLAAVVETLKPLKSFLDQSEQHLGTIIRAHIEASERASHDEHGEPQLWLTREGNELSASLGEKLRAGLMLPGLGPGEYQRLFRLLLGDEVVREPMRQNPPLAILGLLEARLIKSDVVILGGLNEGVWPGPVKSNKWLTRPQLRTAELPSPERRIGLSAHDFAQGFCSRQTFLTHARRRDDAPAVPSRWVLRLEALLSAADMLEELDDRETNWQSLAHTLDRSTSPVFSPPPQARPPVAARPFSFSASSIEKLLKNPYLFYVDKILKLRPLRELDERPGALERGIVIHDALDQLLKNYPSILPAKATSELADDLTRRIEQETTDPVQQVLWQKSMLKIAEWFCEFETENRRASAITSRTEMHGRWSFNHEGIDYEVHARADRIDQFGNGSLVLIDYKTGTPPSFEPSASSFSPQLIVEALIAAHGGYHAVDALEAVEVQYYKLSDGDPPGSLKRLKQPKLKTTMEAVAAGLRQLFAGYADEGQAYFFVSGVSEKPHERPFVHLARANEWLHRLEQGE